jgi:SAM-dependent methyltransferase
MQTFSYKGLELPVELVEKTGGGPGTFDEISRWHIAQVNERIGYRADSVVVEIGCGIGRDAIPLTEILTQGRYIGIDIIRPSIEWCQQNISIRFPNFQFVHFDVEDGLHNPEGKEDVSVCRIPADDASVDIIIGHSVFTHLLEKGIRHYLGEFARVLKANGRAFVTCFVVDEDIRKRIAIEPATPWRISFLHQYGPDCWIDNLEQPLGSVAYTLHKMHSMAEAAGLSLEFMRGNWPASGSQDVLLLSRNAGIARVQSEIGKR